MHQFEAVTWSVVDIPGFSCLDNLQMYLLPDHMLSIGTHHMLPFTDSGLEFWTFNLCLMFAV